MQFIYYLVVDIANSQIVHPSGLNSKAVYIKSCVFICKQNFLFTDDAYVYCKDKKNLSI